MVFRLFVAFMLAASSWTCLADIVVDNDYGAPGYTEVGAWSNNVAPWTGYNGGAYRSTTAAGRSATWTPTFPLAGRFEVYAVFRTGTNRPTDARYTIAHAGGTAVVSVSQYESTSTLAEALLGEFDFNAGSSHHVTLDTLTASKAYIADAIIFRNYNDDPPVISNVTRNPLTPQYTDPVVITASVVDDVAVTSAAVVYTLTPPGTQHTLQAYDDGAHGDGAAGNGVYGATIPAQPAGTTVGYLVRAWDNTGQEASSVPYSYGVAAGPPPEFRAVWADTWNTSILTKAQADTWLATCRANNLNMMLPEIRKVGDAYYNSALEPRAINISDPDPTYDPLGYLVQRAHDTSGGNPRVQVHAWFVMQRISTGSTPPGHILAVHPEYEMIKRDGTIGPTNRYLDPGHPEAVNHNMAVVLDCMGKYDIDGIHFDYIRYPEGTYPSPWGYNTVSVARFNALHGRTGLPAVDDPLWNDWRRECVTLQVKKIYVKAWMLKPNVVLSVSTINWGTGYSNFQTSTAYSGVFQDWVGWLRQGIVDYNAMMNYVINTDMTRFRGWTDLTVAEDDRRGSIVGIGAYLHTRVQGSADQLLYVRSAGAAGMNIYDWGSEVDDNTIGETRAQFYSAINTQVTPTWVDPPVTQWKANPTHGIFEGTVITQGQPIDHARVWIEGHPETETVTDGSGWYGILDVPVGSHTVHFAKTGLRDRLIPASIPVAGNIVTVNADMDVPVSLSQFVAE